ncbi:MAG: hypothetical protein ACLPTF_26505 [Steroidobacteraceae bacterium]
MQRPQRDAALPESLPRELDERIAALESQAECGDDFDVTSLCWLFFLGVLIPIILLSIGWWA